MQIRRSSHLEFSNQPLCITNLCVGQKHEISLDVSELEINLDTKLLYISDIDCVVSIWMNNLKIM
jgi:hypothetical protein